MKEQLLFAFLLFLSSTAQDNNEELCQELHQSLYSPQFNTLESYSDIRYVSFHENSTDSPSCLCRSNPCATLPYALYGGTKSSPTSNITLILATGVHKLHTGLTIGNSTYISLIGVDDTVLECGDKPLFSSCELHNLVIDNSSFVHFYGITFQNCHLGVPMVHIEKSNNIIFNNCIFR